MIYWQIQMFLPEGRGGEKIDSSLLLQETEPVIGTGEWDDIQCRYFKGEEQNGLSIGDIIIVHEGKKPVALCEITGDSFTSDELTEKYLHENFRKVKVLDWYDGNGNVKQAQGTLNRLINAQTPTWQFVNTWYQTYISTSKMKKIIELLSYKKQIILQGAPGTGKTYSTAEIALRIIEKNNINFLDRNEVMNAYNEAIKDGQIVFTTFHQSLDYEEFIEGIKPVIIDKEITYDVIPGIFKKICKKAIQKDSLKELQDAIEKLKEKCMNADEDIILETIEKGKFTVDYRGGITFRVRSLKSQAKEGKDFPASIENIEKFYKGEKDGLYNISYVRGILLHLKKEYKLPDYKGDVSSKKNYVLIIDEINRGNISKIFGELITLLEADKRLDGNNKMTCTLPYSNTEFGVPGNLFIIGTMNTTDRSLGHIDYAIRRRFAFVTLKSEIDAINSFYTTDEELKEMASSLYKRIVQIIGNNISPEFTKEDIMIGHSYFMATNKEELEQKLEFEIKPLLREYVKDGILTLSIDDIKTNIDTVTLN